MVDFQQPADVQHCRFVIRPNRSLSWQGSLWFFLSLLLITIIIASTLTLMGFWLVLPFAGLEMLALGLGLYVVTCRCHECEVVSISPDTVRIQKGRRYPREDWTLGRYWTRVVLEHCPRAWYPSRLLLRSHGRAVEIGRFLHEDERQRLATELSRRLCLTSPVHH